MTDERDDLDLDADLDELDDLGNPSTPPAGGKAQVPPGVFKALRSLNKKVGAIGEQVARLAPKLEPRPAEPPAPPVVPQNSDLEQRVELRLQGFSPDEIALIERNRPQGKSLLDVAKDPFVVAGIAGLREQAKIAAATPPPSASGTGASPQPQRTDADRAADRGDTMARQEQLIAENRRFRGKK